MNQGKETTVASERNGGAMRRDVNSTGYCVERSVYISPGDAIRIKLIFLN
jgi:hypothetical protein